jgi:hypothetical protein
VPDVDWDHSVQTRLKKLWRGREAQRPIDPIDPIDVQASPCVLWVRVTTSPVMTTSRTTSPATIASSLISPIAVVALAPAPSVTTELATWTCLA